MIPERVSHKYQEKLALLESIQSRLENELRANDIHESIKKLPPIEDANFDLAVDPFDKKETLIGTWRDQSGNKIGEIQVMENDSIYAEIDVICILPSNKKWFVESVTAWGSKQDIKAELKLIPNME